MISSVKMSMTIVLLCLLYSSTESILMMCENQTEITNITTLQIPNTSYVSNVSCDCSCSIKSTNVEMEEIVQILIPDACFVFVVLYKNNTDHIQCNNYTYLNYTLNGTEKVILKPDCPNTAGQILNITSLHEDMNVTCYSYHNANNSTPSTVEVSGGTNVPDDAEVSGDAQNRKLDVRILGGLIGGGIWLVSLIVLVLCIVKHKEGYPGSSSYRKKSSVSSFISDQTTARRTGSVTTVSEQVEIIPNDLYESSDAVFKDNNDTKNHSTSPSRNNPVDSK